VNDEIKILVGVPSPREIPEALDAIFRLPADIFLAKYYPEPEAYEAIRDFFIQSRKDYDYLCIIPDDLVVHQEGFQILVEDLNKYKPQILSGVCNLDADTMKEFYAVRIDRKDPFLYKAHKKQHFPNTRYQLVFTAGFACMFVSKQVVEKVPFRQFSPTFESAIDQAFAEDCLAKRIPTLVDWAAEFEHLEYRLGHGQLENFYKGHREPYQLFIENGIKNYWRA
jgi:hypothetical protein